MASALISSPALASHPEVSLPGSNFEIDTDASLKVDDAASALKDFIAPTPLNLATCGAIKVTKTRKHAADGTSSHPHAGVAFTVNGVTQTTDALNGQTCFDNLQFGSYSVTETLPAGYVADGPLTKTVVVDNVASCTATPYVGADRQASATLGSPPTCLSRSTRRSMAVRRRRSSAPDLAAHPWLAAPPARTVTGFGLGDQPPAGFYPHLHDRVSPPVAGSSARTSLQTGGPQELERDSAPGSLTVGHGSAVLERRRRARRRVHHSIAEFPFLGEVRTAPRREADGLSIAPADLPDLAGRSRSWPGL